MAVEDIFNEEIIAAIRRRHIDLTIEEFEQWAGARLTTENRDRLQFEFATTTGHIQMLEGESLNDCIKRVWADADNGSSYFRKILDNRR